MGVSYRNREEQLMPKGTPSNNPPPDWRKMLGDMGQTQLKHNLGEQYQEHMRNMGIRSGENRRKYAQIRKAHPELFT